MHLYSIHTQKRSIMASMEGVCPTTIRVILFYNQEGKNYLRQREPACFLSGLVFFVLDILLLF